MEFHAGDAKIQTVEIEGVSSDRCSALAVQGGRGRSAVVLVHGIFDCLWRWLTPDEAVGLAIVDERPPIPLFDVAQPRRTLLGDWTGPFVGAGLFSRLAGEGLPAIAYSYQDLANPIATMSDAVERLHRTTAWAMETLDVDKVVLVGHSRGGLVCRHALTTSSPALSAEQFRRCVDRVIAVCTPHQGSRVAEFVDLWTKTVSQLGEWSAPLWDLGPRLAPLDAAAELLRAIGRLTPASEEIVQAATSRMPALPGGYYAVAGSTATYFAASFRGGGGIRLPPELGVPEFIDGEGDMAVSVASALDSPGADADRARIYPYNHLTLPYATEVHDQLLRWILTAC